MWFAYIVIAIASFFLWATMHELMHVWGMKRTGKLLRWQIFPYPHFNRGYFYFARVRYWYREFITAEEQAVVSLAPRIPGIIAALLLPPAIAMGWWIPAILLAGGVIDIFVGSLGMRSTSDLRRAAVCLDIGPWYLRIAGMAIVAGSILGTLLLVL